MLYGTLAKSCVGSPSPKGWRPHIGEILDPPLPIADKTGRLLLQC